MLVKKRGTLEGAPFFCVRKIRYMYNLQWESCTDELFYVPQDVVMSRS